MAVVAASNLRRSGGILEVRGMLFLAGDVKKDLRKLAS